MNALCDLDRVLRGEPLAGDSSAIRLRPLIFVLIVLAAVYGCCMGSFGLLGAASRSTGRSWHPRSRCRRCSC